MTPQQETLEELRNKNKALYEAIMNDNLVPYSNYCDTMKIPQPDNPRIVMGAICKSALKSDDLGDEVKAQARKILATLGLGG